MAVETTEASPSDPRDSRALNSDELPSFGIPITSEALPVLATISGDMSITIAAGPSQVTSDTGTSYRLFSLLYSQSETEEVTEDPSGFNSYNFSGDRKTLWPPTNTLDRFLTDWERK